MTKKRTPIASLASNPLAHFLECFVKDMATAYAVITLAYDADLEDYRYASRVLSSNDLKTVASAIVSQADEAERLYCTKFNKSPRIVGSVVLRHASGRDINLAACARLWMSLMRYCIQGDGTGCWVANGKTVPRVTTGADGFSDSELDVVAKNFTTRSAEGDATHLQEVAKPLPPGWSTPNDADSRR